MAYELIGTGFALLGLAFTANAFRRHVQVEQALARGDYARPDDRFLAAATAVALQLRGVGPGEDAQRRRLHEHAGDDQGLAPEPIGEVPGPDLARAPHRRVEARGPISAALAPRAARNSGMRPQASASFMLLTRPAWEQERTTRLRPSA